jgi:hypothetical protein
MAYPAAFAILLGYTCSIFCYPQGVCFWPPAMLLQSLRVPILISTDCPNIYTVCWHTQHHTTAFTAHQSCPQKRMRFKYLLLLAISTTMPLLLHIEVCSSLQESRFVITPSVSTTTSTTSHGTSLNANGEDDFTFLARLLQGIPTHAPPGP